MEDEIRCREFMVVDHWLSGGRKCCLRAYGDGEGEIWSDGEILLSLSPLLMALLEEAKIRETLRSTTRPCRVLP